MKEDRRRIPINLLGDEDGSDEPRSYSETITNYAVVPTLYLGRFWKNPWEDLFGFWGLFRRRRSDKD